MKSEIKINIEHNKIVTRVHKNEKDQKNYFQKITK